MASYIVMNIGCGAFWVWTINFTTHFILNPTNKLQRNSNQSKLFSSQKYIWNIICKLSTILCWYVGTKYIDY